MTRLTADERLAIQANLDEARAEVLRLCDEITRLQSMLDAQPAGSDGDTLRLLRALCSCGLPLDHRHPLTGEPRPCADETARIALDELPRSRPPVPSSVTRDESPMTERAADAILGLVELDRELRGGGVCVCSHTMLRHSVITGLCTLCGRDACTGYRTHQ